MSFLSFNFAVFLGVALLLYYLVRPQWRPGFLLFLSYAFYLTWSPLHALLLLALTIGVYFTALWIERSRAERGKFAWTVLGVMVLLIILFVFKAGTWLAKEFPAAGPALLLVPIGLSYYTFKMVGYLLDVYWETLPAQRNFVSVALYSAFFPQILSGPIQRAEDFFGQMDKLKNPDTTGFLTGLRRILFGLFKKVVVADRLAPLIESVHANPSGFSPLELLLGAYCFAIQLYMDFSGLTDIAIGVGQLFGVKGPENFDLPFYSANLQLFWRHWHMSLTTWLTDYLFTPLRMTFRKLATAGLCLAIFINMIAIGLWHELSLKFLVFGMIHGVFMAISVLTLKRRDLFFKTRPVLLRLRKVAGPLLTFHLVVFSLIFFRAQSFQSALEYLGGFVSHAVPVARLDWSLLGLPAATLLGCLALFFVSDFITWTSRRQPCIDWFFATPRLLRLGFYYASAAVVLFFFKGTMTFIYAGF